MPPLHGDTRFYVDFRNADGPDYRDRVTELVRRLESEPPRRRARTGELQPAARQRLHGLPAPVPCGCRSDRERTTLSAASLDVSGPPPVADFDVAHHCNWRLERARKPSGADPRCRPVLARTRGRVRTDAGGRVGRKLADAFLPPTVTAALAQRDRRGRAAERARSSSRSTSPSHLADLPWETVRLPRHRAARTASAGRAVPPDRPGGAAPAINIPGPLRILVAIGSPEAQNARGELLGHGGRACRILDATESRAATARRSSASWRPAASRAIHAALEQER